jgi:Ca2+-binding RTX toxin-like protein
MAIAASTHLSSLNGQNGFYIQSSQRFDQLDSSFQVNPAGDINGDSIQDIILANPAAIGQRQPQTYVIFGQRGGFPRQFNLAQLNGSNGFVVAGSTRSTNGSNTVGANTVEAVRGVGDVNGDGVDDLAVTERQVANGKLNYRLSVIHGRQGLESLNGLMAGLQITGFGENLPTVSRAGDFNGDRVADLLIGIPNASLNPADPRYENQQQGKAYVVFGQRYGSSGTAPREIDLSTDLSANLSKLNGSNGFEVTGIRAQEYFGNPVHALGDVNGDGLDDIVVGAFGRGVSVSETGESYVIFGRSPPFQRTSTISELIAARNGQQNGFVIQPIQANYGSGDVSGAGDVNGDGIQDIIVGAPYVETGRGALKGFRAGRSYVIFGTRQGFPDAIDPKTIDPKTIDPKTVNGENGFAIDGATGYNFLGTSVSRAGDINNDGIDDLLIGARGEVPNTSRSNGQAYIVFGKRDRFSPALSVADLNGSNGFAIQSFATHPNGRQNSLGSIVRGIGDINGDGIDDIVLNNPRSRNADETRLSPQQAVIFGGALYGSATSDRLTSTDPLHVVYGFAGDDILVGQASDDMLLGGSGNDQLSGDGGADELVGDGGRDRLSGGAGRDRFVFDFGRSVDWITDFVVGEDQIVLNRATFTRLRGDRLRNNQPRFAVVNTIAQAASSRAEVVYVKTGALFYNANSTASGFGNGGRFANLASGLALTATSFAVR